MTALTFGAIFFLTACEEETLAPSSSKPNTQAKLAASKETAGTCFDDTTLQVGEARLTTKQISPISGTQAGAAETTE